MAPIPLPRASSVSYKNHQSIINRYDTTQEVQAHRTIELEGKKVASYSMAVSGLIERHPRGLLFIYTYQGITLHAIAPCYQRGGSAVDAPSFKVYGHSALYKARPHGH